MTTYLSPVVDSKETNLSQITQVTANSAVALVGAAGMGPIGPTLFTSDKAFLAAMGPPVPSIGFAHYSALAVLRKGGKVWFRRAVTSAALSAVMKYTNDGTNPEGLGAGTASANPLGYSFTNSADVWIAYPVGPGAAYNTNIVLRISNVNASKQAFTLSVFNASNMNVPLEVFNVSVGMGKDGYGRQTFMEQVINNQSQYIRVLVNSASQVAMSALPTGSANNVAFTGGVDGNNVSDAEVIAGWNDFLDTTAYAVGLLGNCGYALPTVQNKMDAVAQARNDCIAILDTPPSAQSSAAALNTYRTTTLNLNSTFSSLWAPDYYYYDDINDLYLYVPISGGVLACAVANDAAQYPWIPFAGIGPGQLPNCYGLRTKFTQGIGSDYDTLYPNQVNLALVQPGAGYCLWGNKTLASVLSSLSYIHVRRLLNMTEPAAARAVRPNLFKLNTSFLQARVVELLTKFYRQVAATGVLYAYQVVCDASNNPPVQEASGQLNVDQYLQVAPDVEAIQSQSVLTPLGSSFTSLIASGGNFN